MQLLKFGNIYYFFYLMIAVVLTLLFLAFLKHKTQKFRYWFLFGLIMLNFLIHIFKIFIWPYTTLDYVLTKITFENICAVSAITFPFLYFTKNKTLKDYMVMAGIASGIIALLIPVDAMSEYFNGEIIGFRPWYNLEIIRFYITHYLIFLVPFLMMHYHFHEFSIKRAWRMPLMLFGVLIIIFINEALVTLFGWVPQADFFDPSKRNPSFIFGVRGDLTGVGVALGLFVPAFLRINPFYSGVGYFPVLWLLIPALVYGGLISLLFMLIYDREETLIYLKLKVRIPAIDNAEQVRD